MNKGISETAFASQVYDLLNLFQWRWCHIRPAWSNKGYRTPIQGSDPDGFKGKGLPDIIAVRPPRLLFIELKDQYAKPSPEQEAWLEDLKECQKTSVDKPLPVEKGVNIKNFLKGCKFIQTPEVYLWKPSQLETEIMEVLR